MTMAWSMDTLMHPVDNLQEVSMLLQDKFKVESISDNKFLLLQLRYKLLKLMVLKYGFVQAVIFQTKYQIKNAIYAKLKKVILLHINQM
jgi:hypothetical protein